MKKDYATLVCGGVPTVKKMLVEELRMNRRKAGLKPNELDAVLGFTDDWPRIAEIETDSGLLTLNFILEITQVPKSFSPDFAKNLAIVLTIDNELRASIKNYLAKTPYALESALEEFHEGEVPLAFEIQQETADKLEDGAIFVLPTVVAREYVRFRIMTQLVTIS